MTHRGAIVAVGFLAVLVSLLPAERADACGGFFCSQVPVTQDGEHIAFVAEQDSSGDTLMTVHIQIQYTGAAADFGWILPVPSVPEIAVGSDAIFASLRASTDPQHYVQWQNDVGECQGWGGVRGGFGDEADADFAGAEGEAPAPSVQVISEREVGPYETVVLRSLDGDAQAILDWLDEHGYVVPEGATGTLQSYVNANHVFVALRLANDESAGSIQPIVLKMREPSPCIPLLLTAIAANPDMPIFAWMFGPSGVVPVNNFYEVELNPAAIDWFSWYGTNNYRAVASRALDEAGGRGFIKEFAGTTERFNDLFYVAGRYDLDRLRGLQDPEMFINELLSQGFPRDASMQNLLREFIPMPQELVDQGVPESDFYNCLSCYAEYVAGIDFDPEAFVQALDERIVRPMRDFQGAIDEQRYVTRLFTAISPDEMTEDPIFRFREGVASVDNVHTAQAQYLCADGQEYEHAPIRITYPDGTVQVLNPNDEMYPNPERWQWEDADADGVNDNVPTAPDSVPSLLRAIRHQDADDGSTTVIDNSEMIRDRIRGGTYGRGGGCSASGGAPVGSLYGLALLGLALAWLRRRS